MTNKFVKNENIKRMPIFKKDCSEEYFLEKFNNYLAKNNKIIDD